MSEHTTTKQPKTNYLPDLKKERDTLETFEAPQPPQSYVGAPAKSGGEFVPCRVYFRESFRVAGISKAMLDCERDKATYNPATGVIRAELGALKFELSLHGGWGPAVNIV